MTEPSACPGWMKTGRAHLVAAVCDLHQVGRDHALLLRRLGTEDRRIVPGELRDRPGPLLQPSVVGEPAVIHRRIGTENQLQPLRTGRWRLRLRQCRGPARAQRDVPDWQRRVRHCSIVNRLAPPGFEVRARMLRGPVVFHNLVRGALQLPRQHGQHFVRGLARVERRDQRLHDGHRAIVCPAVAPRLQVMGHGQVPVAKLAGLVFVQAQVDA